MKYMILVKATKDSEAGVMPSDALISEMVGFHEEMAKAGILVDGAGLRRSADGWRIRFDKGGKRTLVDGPFTETKELVAGYTIIDVKSGEGEIEVRPYFALEDFEQGPGVEKARELGLQRN